MKGSKIILVAEDAAPDFFLLERAFGLAGLSHRLIHVRSGSEAMSYLRSAPPFDDRSKHPFPDLVLIDGSMPRGSGMDVLKFSRQEGFVVPIVMLSGSGLPGDIQTALSLGAAEYLCKPDAVSDLVVLAQTIHHRWLNVAAR